MNDEELGQFLRNEVPAPKADYWANIDAALGGPDSAADPEQHEESEPHWETEADIIRLTDMDTNMLPIRHRTRTLWLSVAAAIFVVIGGFVVVLATENGNNTATAANSNEQDGNSQTDGGDVIGSEQSTDDSTASEETPDEAADESATPEESSEQTDGGDSAADEDPERDGDPVYWDFTYGSTINMRDEPSFEGLVIGRWAGDEQSILGTGRSETVKDYEWVELTYPWNVDGSRETGWVGREFLEVSTAPPGINDPVITDGQPEVWNFVAAGQVFARTWPGFGGLIQGSWAGDEQGIEGTGRTAVANGFEWVELAAGEERSESWVARDFLAQAGLDTNLGCYLSGGDAMVLQFASDALTFVGALRIPSDFGPEYFGVAGRRTVGTAFEVAVQSNGTTETRVQEWLATGEGMSAGNLAFVDAISCDLMPDEIAELDQIVLSYPDTP